MKNLFTITLLILSLNTFATETECEKSNRLDVETSIAMDNFNIDSDKFDSLLSKVVNSVSESRNYNDVIDSMLLNNNISKEYHLTIGLFFESFKQRLICNGEY